MSSPREIGGYIGAHKLTEWWLSAFSEEERQRIESAYRPMGGSSTDSLLTGSSGLQINGRAGSFLANLAEWLNKPASRDLAHRVIEHAELIATDVLEKHDVYQESIVVNYRDRDKDPSFLGAAIDACEKQIAIAPEVMRAWTGQRKSLPTHKGFEQLAIIREKEGNYTEAIRLTREAKAQGWKGSDWDGRLARYERKLAKKIG